MEKKTKSALKCSVVMKEKMESYHSLLNGEKLKSIILNLQEGSLSRYPQRLITNSYLRALYFVINNSQLRNSSNSLPIGVKSCFQRSNLKT